MAFKRDIVSRDIAGHTGQTGQRGVCGSGTNGTSVYKYTVLSRLTLSRSVNLMEVIVEIISRDDARAKGLSHYFTGKPCPRGHIAPRFVSSRGCKECCREKMLERVAKDRDAHNEKQRQWRTENRGKWKEYRKAHYEKHKDKNLERSREYKERNRERLREYQAEYMAGNMERFLEYNALRRAARKERTPVWLSKEDREKIRELYAEAARLTQETGVQHVVDHFYPLRGDVVSGLHIPQNMRVITESENARKGNKLVEEGLW